jgi:Fe-S oxidoreductase
MGLSDVNEWIYGCTRCGACKNVLNLSVPSCPAGERYQLESYFPSGRQFIVRGLFEGKLALEDDELRKRIEACTACLSCQQQCGVYHHEHIFEMVRASRTEAVTQGFLNPAYMGMVDNLKREDNVFGRPKAERDEWARDLGVKNAIQEKVDVLYHIGCMLSSDPELWEVPKSLFHIMQAAGVNVGIMGKEETCCGSRAYEIGYVGEFTKYAENCLEAFNSLGVEKVVTSCSDGYSTFKSLYPKVNIKMRFEVLHVVEYLDQLIKEGRIQFTKDVPMKVTYHDPCHLGRHLSPGVYDPPRSLLKSISGIELVEMDRNKENSWCCGAGGGVKEANPDLALWTAHERLKEALATGAKALVTSCPWCERNFKDAIKAYGEEIEIYDIAEIARKAI